MTEAENFFLRQAKMSPSQNVPTKNLPLSDSLLQHGFVTDLTEHNMGGSACICVCNLFVFVFDELMRI